MLDVRLAMASVDRLRRNGPVAQWIRHRPTEPAPRQNETPRGLCSEVVSAFGHPAVPRGSQVARGMLWWSLQIRCSIVASISACRAEDPGSIPGGGDRATRKFEIGPAAQWTTPRHAEPGIAGSSPAGATSAECAGNTPSAAPGRVVKQMPD